MAIDLDWRSLAGAVAPLAPKIGGLLGAAFPPFGGIIGSIAGNALAAAFGVPATPAAVGKAIAEDPRAAEKLERLEALESEKLIQQAQVQIEALKQHGETARTNSEQINETIRTEAAANVSNVSRWHWRNTIGHLVVAYGVQQIVLIFTAAYFPKVLPPADLVLLFNSTVVFTGGLFALLGYVASDTTDRYKTAITGDRGTGGVVENIIKAVKPAPKPVIIGKPIGSRD